MTVSSEALSIRKPICPECLQGKHRNCVGQALDPVTDEIVSCQCDCEFGS